MNRFTRIVRILLAIAICTAFLSCAGRPEPRAQTGAFRGYFTKNHQVSAFAPCGLRQAWWAGGRTGPMVRAVASLKGRAGGTIYVEFTGELSPPGRFGYRSAYPRQVVVRHVTLARAPGPGDCGPKR